MTLTTADQVRLRIQDQPRIADLTMYGDGLLSTFDLKQGAATYRNITSGSAFVPTTAGWSGTGCAYNTSGFVAFSGVVSANSAFRLRFVHSVFSDDEIGHYTAVGGSVIGAAREAVWTLRFDALKRAKWAAPDGSTYDDTAAIAALKQMYDDLTTELDYSETTDGGWESWPEGQELFW